MIDNKLTDYMSDCQQNSKDATILVPQETHLGSAIKILINGCNDSIKALIWFDESNDKSLLFESISKNDVLFNIIDFLNEENTTLYIITNKQKKIRNSDLFEKLENITKNKSTKKLFLSSIQPSEIKTMKENGLHHVYRSSYHLTPASNRCLVYATLVLTS
ncbi:hypothetical protein, partial [Aeromonas veronii]|uniref:hypothetical protein n=1 Tax=Aeromonas veronii TaxID=654 RepID=UPI0030055DED